MGHLDGQGKRARCTGEGLKKAVEASALPVAVSVTEEPLAAGFSAAKHPFAEDFAHGTLLFASFHACAVTREPLNQKHEHLKHWSVRGCYT